MTRWLADPRRWILAFYVLCVFAIQLYMGRPSELSWLGIELLFLAWAVLPVALLCLGREYATAKAIGAALLAVFGLAMYGDTAFIHPDAQGGLIFIFLPLYQLVLAALWIVGIVVVAWLRRQSRRE